MKIHEIILRENTINQIQSKIDGNFLKDQEIYLIFEEMKD
jgi:hypothetical protein